MHPVLPPRSRSSEGRAFAPLRSGAVPLAASTVYYAYAFMVGQTMQLEFSTTAFAFDVRGLPIKNGDATRTLIGMVSFGG